MSTKETGHSANAVSYETLISRCRGYGVTYSPSKEAIKIAAMESQLVKVIAVLNNEKDKFNDRILAVDEREIIFEHFSTFVSRIISAVESSEVTEQMIQDVKSLRRKLTGQRAGSKLKKADDILDKTLVEGNDIITTGDGAAPADEHKQISVSQMGFNSRLSNLSKLVNLLGKESGYNPNEKDLQVKFLEKLLVDMKTKNTAVINVEGELSNARFERDKIMYTDKNCMFDAQREAKSYVKSVFGHSSPEYKQISKIKFTRPR